MAGGTLPSLGRASSTLSPGGVLGQESGPNALRSRPWSGTASNHTSIVLILSLDLCSSSVCPSSTATFVLNFTGLSTRTRSPYVVISMFPWMTRKKTIFLVIVFGKIVLVSFIFHHGVIKFPAYSAVWQTSTMCLENKGQKEKLSRIQPESMQQPTEQEVKDIFNKIDQQVPHAVFMNMKYSTSAQKSRGTILNIKDTYCIGENLTVQLDMYDQSGKRKTHGGDFLRARIYSPYLNAGASGRIEDFNNGTYLVHFTLFWAGRVNVSLSLFHPSEGVSALWRARNQGYENVYFTGIFTSAPKDVQTACGLSVNTTKELCKYQDDRDHEYFYCVKPKNVSCAAFAYLKSSNTQHSYLSNTEKQLFVRSNVAVEIPRSFGYVAVLQCNRSLATSKAKCQTGMRSSFPSGYFYQNIWQPLFCTASDFKPGDQVNSCLKGKMIHLLGDSTLRQWIGYFPKLVNSLKFFDLHGTGRHKTLLAFDMDRNLRIQWKKHSHPFLTMHFFTVKDEAYVTREIDRLGGGKHTVVVLTLGQHFRPFPIQIFLRRAVNIRRSVERLFLRSPDTKVIIKTENTREISLDSERFSDFHGYVQYLVLKDIFQDLNVGVIDAWDMTTALALYKIHPPDYVLANQFNMLLTYIC